MNKNLTVQLTMKYAFENHGIRCHGKNPRRESETVYISPLSVQGELEELTQPAGPWLPAPRRKRQNSECVLTYNNLPIFLAIQQGNVFQSSFQNKYFLSWIQKKCMIHKIRTRYIFSAISLRFIAGASKLQLPRPTVFIKPLS